VGPQGDAQYGTIQAAHPALAHLRLHREGIQVSRLRPARHPSPTAPIRAEAGFDQGSRAALEQHPRTRFIKGFRTRRRRSKATGAIVFYQQLATLLGAGLPVLQALNLTADSLPPGELSNAVRQVSAAIEDGQSLADAMGRWPNIFDALSVNLIRVGEAAGMLDSTIQRVADSQSRAARLRSQVRSAMTYPIAVLATAVLVCGLLLTQLVPQFSTTFQNLGAELPPLTQAVVRLSDWVLQYGMLLLGSGIVIGLFTTRLGRRQPRLQQLSDRLLLMMPVLGPVIRTACMARMFQTLASTLAAGLPLLDALQAVAEVADNHVYRQASLRLAEQVNEGQRLGVAVRLSHLFPVMMVQLIETGDESGTLETMLVKCAEICEQQVEQSVTTLTRLLEPAIMAVLGLLTGTLMLAMYLPIFQLGAAL